MLYFKAQSIQLKSYLAKIVIHIYFAVQVNQLSAVENDVSYDWEEMKKGSVSGIDDIYEEDGHTVIHLSQEIPGKCFVQLLHFLYTGRYCIE